MVEKINLFHIMASVVNLFHLSHNWNILSFYPLHWLINWFSECRVFSNSVWLYCFLCKSCLLSLYPAFSPDSRSLLWWYYSFLWITLWEKVTNPTQLKVGMWLPAPPYINQSFCFILTNNWSSLVFFSIY